MASAYDNLILGHPNLVSFWPLDETSGTTVTDDKGGVNGSIVNGGQRVGEPTLLADDGASSILFTNSFGTRIDTTPDSNQYLNLAPFTAECWFKVRNYNTASGANIIDHSGHGFHGWSVVLENPAVTLKLYRCDGVACDVLQFTTSEASLQASGRHLVCTYDGTNRRMYLDGVLVAGPTASTRNVDLPTGTPHIAIGANQQGGSGHDGWIQKVAIYNIALSQDIVRSHFDQGGGTLPTFIHRGGKGSGW